MPRISIVFGYRNRDVFRVKQCLDSLRKQTFSDFEVVFIDYGSEENFSSEIELLIKSYDFVKYHYSYTTGFPWNRAHALNSGVRLATSEYILFGDIDLVYSYQVLESLYRGIITDEIASVQVYSSVYFLPKGFSAWGEIDALQFNKYPHSDDSGRGGVHLVAKKHIELIRGYDEFYCFWGVEDRDLYSRLNRLGLKSKWINRELYPVYHQWHNIVSNQKGNFFPDKWWEEVNIYFQKNVNNIVRNTEHWGKIINKSDRPVFEMKPIFYKIPTSYIKSYMKAELICDTILHIDQLKDDECLQIELVKNRTTFIFSWMIKYTNNFLRRLRFPIGIDYLYNLEKERYSNLTADMMFIVWRLIKYENYISDYSIEEINNKIIIKLKK